MKHDHSKDEVGTGGSPAEGAPADTLVILRQLFDCIAAQDRKGAGTALSALTAHNPALAEDCHALETTYQLMRDALLADVRACYQEELDIFRTRFESDLAALQPKLVAESIDTAARSEADSEGVLTHLTSRLDPSEAILLYQRMAPELAAGILAAMNRGREFSKVQRLAIHLCAPATVARLRAAEHVRDAILDEVSHALRDLDASCRLGRADLDVIIQEAGINRDLATLEKCIVMGRGVA